MKIIIPMACICLIGMSAFAQTPARRSISWRNIGRGDSINLHMNENYFMIEDTCSKIVRYGRLSFQTRTFKGKFRDLNKIDPQIVVAEGTYTEEGLLTGPLVMNYLNGDPQGTGTFKDNKMVGRWDLFYPGNKKRLEFDNNNGTSKINNYWDAAGKQLVKDGNGTYRVDLENIYWEGKLENGTPDGTWRSRNINDRTGTILSSETFKNGVFVKGGGPGGSYSDVSRIELTPNALLPIANAQKLYISPEACDPSNSTKSFVYATYRHGSQEFTREIQRVVGPVFAKVNMRMFWDKVFTIEGVVNEKGVISSLKYVNTFDDRQSGELLAQLIRLPGLFPTLENGKPVKSAIFLKFTINQGQYWTTWAIRKAGDPNPFVVKK